MARKAIIIKHLEMMGYSVTIDGPIYKISLTSADGSVYQYAITDIQIQTGEFIVERIVHAINDMIINDVVSGTGEIK